MTAATPLFGGMFLGGFECSSHRRRDLRRLDLLASTRHDRLAAADYAALRRNGIATVRDGLRWHRIETAPGHYDWSSALPMLHAARDTGMGVIWDLCHYGWPDDLDVWSPAFVDRFARFSAAAARLIADETQGAAAFCPINEISFMAWAGGEVGYMNPGTKRRGGALKQQLVRAAIAAIEAIRALQPAARFLTAEPLIHVESRGRQRRSAEAYRLSQFEATDMLGGWQVPELGGHPGLVDIVGVNFYPRNQWFHKGTSIPLGDHAFRPLSEMLAEVHQRYNRPLMLAETGSEGSARAAWLHYVCDEVRIAQRAGVPVGGICLYPVVDYPGWDNNRPCQVGLLSQPAADGTRQPYQPLALELRRQQTLFSEAQHAPALREDTLS